MPLVFVMGWGRFEKTKSMHADSSEEGCEALVLQERIVSENGICNIYMFRPSLLQTP